MNATHSLEYRTLINIREALQEEVGYQSGVNEEEADKAREELAAIESALKVLERFPNRLHPSAFSLVVETPKGTMVAEKTSDPENPGIAIDIDGLGAALVEARTSEENDIYTLVWNEENEDYVNKVKWSK
ncbi:hypothetical protein IMZ31_24300 (plasmid) [Pontibacillus sp. ALD_SL1]|uniref:hypothetical protein n=1 Tax=Pontibacillus sp. ALD_SL1 TaxID=2777185 RepID=UPI001A97B67A|nr:hypothetical protein [Pontibacillus sp. ALD_SL1]QST02575.1 hypothetical protein IMZ31_24300 [Pontibacillus sp. ALD_SL1]